MPSDRDVDHLLRRVAELDERVRRLEELVGGGGAAVDPGGVSAHVRELVAAGHKIEAIRAYREETGAGLREAKQRIEALAP